MISADLLCCPLAQRLVLTLTHFLWQGGAIAVLVLVGSALVGPQVQRRYMVSLLGLLLLIACPVVTFIAIEQSPKSLPVNKRFTSAWSSIPHYHDVNAVHGAGPSGTQTIDARAIGNANSYWEVLSPWLLTGWLAGVGLFSCRLLVGVASIAWLKRTGEQAGEVLCARAEELCRRINMRVPVVRVSRRVTQAMAVGFWRPVIIVPSAWLIQLPPDCLEAVLAHELAHIRRRDLWVNLLQRVVETFLFYHPAVWWLSARLRSQREMCCDELAVSLTGRRVEYASTLELVARRRRAYASPALAAGIGGEKMALLNRVRNILGLSPAGAGVGPWTLGAVALLAAATVSWLALTGNPVAAFADDGGEDTLVALQDGEGEREREEGERQRDGESEEGEREGGDREREDGEREGRRDGDRERDERRDGDRPRREGDFRRDGDRPRPPAEGDFHRRIEEMKRRAHALAEQGRREEAEAVEREIRAHVERFENARRDGDRPHPERHPEIHPEVRERLGQLQRQLAEAREAGREGAVRELEQEIRNIHERIRARHEGERDRPRPDGDRPFRPDFRRPEGGPNPELMQVIRELREEVMRLRNEVNELKGGRGEGDRSRFEGDRPRFDREGERPRFDSDRPRFDGDRPRGEGERDRPRFRPDREREGDQRGEGERPREREREESEREDGEE